MKNDMRLRFCFTYIYAKSWFFWGQNVFFEVVFHHFALIVTLVKQLSEGVKVFSLQPIFWFDLYFLCSRFLTLRIKGGRGTRQNEDIFICFVFEPQFVFCDQDWFLILVFFSLFRNHFLNENRFDNQVSSFTRCSIFLSHIFPWYFSQNFWVWFSSFG